MAIAKNGDTVKVHYTGTLDDGTQFDSSVGGNPLEFKIGEGALLEKFETAVIGLEPGQSNNVHIPAEDGYGLVRDDLIATVPKTNLPPEISPEVGMQLKMQTPDGGAMILRITEVMENAIKVNANHELAGENLNFKIDLLEILS